MADLAEVTCDHHDLGVTSVLGAESFLCHYTTHCFSLCRCCTFLACDCRMNCPEACTCLHDEVSVTGLKSPRVPTSNGRLQCRNF